MGNTNQGAPASTKEAQRRAFEAKQAEEEEKKKEPEIPIDELCKHNIDPFYTNLDINDKNDEFMRHQYEIEFSDIAGFPTDYEYEVTKWRGSKDLICCKIYYDTSKRSKSTALLLWCRTVKKVDNVDDKTDPHFIEVNLIDITLKKVDKKHVFDPSDVSCYKLRNQYYIHLHHSGGKQQRLKCQLHPRRPLLFTFTRQSITNGVTFLEFFDLTTAQSVNFVVDSNKSYLVPNGVFSFGFEYYLNNEQIEQNRLHFVSKKLKGVQHEYVFLFHKPEIEQNISSGSKLIYFDITEKSVQIFKKHLQTFAKSNGTYNQNNIIYNNYNNSYGFGNLRQYSHSLNFNTLIWNTLHVGQTYHHNLIDIFPRAEDSEKILILFRIHHVNLINHSNAAAPPVSLGQLDPNSNFNFESWSEIYYVDLDLIDKNVVDIKKNGFESLPLSKTSEKESNCVNAVKFTEDGKFFAIIKQREHNNEALFRMYETGQTDKTKYLCQMTNIDIKPWMIQLRSHFSDKFGYFFSISHFTDDIDKAWMILAGPNVHGDLQLYRDILREFLYDDAISVVIAMIGLAHRYTMHLDIGYLAGEQMADFDYNNNLDAIFFAVDDASYMLFQNNTKYGDDEESD